MSKTKIVALLALLVFFSSILSVVSAADFPFTFPTPTAVPTPTPEPTPTPTPKPEPTVWPSLDIKLESSTQADNPKIQVTGTLTYNNSAIPGASVYVGYSADDGASWKNVSWVQTRSDGTYGAVWIPNATGNYKVNVHWEGNDTLHWLDASANLALAADGVGNEYAVVSNSSIVDLSFDSQRKALSFVTNGTDGSTGYMYVCVPKTLASSSHLIGLTMDGVSVQFASEEQADAWVLAYVYSQSSHQFTVQLPSIDVINSNNTPWTLIAAVAAAVVAVVVVALLLVVRRRRRTAATVAAILKQPRQQF